MRPVWLRVSGAALLLGAICAHAWAEGGSSVLASAGCPMAHCDRTMSDQALMPSPQGPVVVRWRDRSRVGSNVGLGCSSNGSRAVCSFMSGMRRSDTLTAYDADGRQLWSSPLPDATAWTSAPIVDAAGGAIIADSQQVVRFDKWGAVQWQAATPGGVVQVPLDGLFGASP